MKILELNYNYIKINNDIEIIYYNKINQKNKNINEIINKYTNIKNSSYK